MSYRERLAVLLDWEESQHQTYREKVALALRREPEITPAIRTGLDALAALATVTSEKVPGVRTNDIFGAPPTGIALPLNRKTTTNERKLVTLAKLEPRQELIPVAGMMRYIVKPRRDPPDVAHVVTRDGRERWLVQEGHTRLGAALLRGEDSMDVRVWEFVEDEAGTLQPVPRGLQKRGMAYRDKVRSLSGDPMSALHPDWQLHKEGLVRAFSLPNQRACASFIEDLMHEANRANHHPDIHVADCVVTVTYVTHSAGDTITEQDFDGAALADRLYDTTPDMAINMPDIADVSFPSMIGAIPSKPKRTPAPLRKRRRVKYKGVSLSRPPTKFEVQVLNLAEIPVRLDAARDACILDDTMMAMQMHDIARYGAEQVLEELIKQGGPVRLRSMYPALEADVLYFTLMDERSREIADVRAHFERRLLRRRIDPERRAVLLSELMEQRLPGLMKRYANRAINWSFAYGRYRTIQQFRRVHIEREFELAKKDDEFDDDEDEKPSKKYKDDEGKFISKATAIGEGYLNVDAVVQVAVMDTNTCDECSLVDGEVMELGDKRQLELDPPYVKCYGGDNCRCVQIALLEDGTEIDVDEIPEEAFE